MISSSSSERVWPIQVPEFFITEVVALGFTLPLASSVARWMVRAWALASIWWRATRMRRSGSAMRPLSSTPTYLIAMSETLAAPAPSMREPPWPERSCCSRRLPIVQPPLSGPTMSSFSARASVKKVSQNGELPAISLIGRVSTPGWRMLISTKLMPSCFLVVSVRTRQKHQSAYCAPLVQIFEPLIRQWSPASSHLVVRLARSEPAPGSE